MDQTGECSRCGKFTVLVPLHLERGGPLLCLSCGQRLHEAARREAEWKAADAARMRGLFVPLDYAGPDELDRELLIDTLALTHPDRHPPERATAAHRVTAALTALLPHTKPKAPPPTPPENAPPKPTGIQVTPLEDLEEALPPFLRSTFPCPDCKELLPYYYCDTCRGLWEQKQRYEREPVNAAARRRRARRRALKAGTCTICGKEFRGKRRDAATCSDACRQKAYRAERTKAKIALDTKLPVE